MPLTRFLRSRDGAFFRLGATHPVPSPRDGAFFRLSAAHPVPSSARRSFLPSQCRSPGTFVRETELSSVSVSLTRFLRPRDGAFFRLGATHPVPSSARRSFLPSQCRSPGSAALITIRAGIAGLRASGPRHGRTDARSRYTCIRTGTGTACRSRTGIRGAVSRISSSHMTLARHCRPGGSRRPLASGATAAHGPAPRRPARPLPR